MYVSFAFGVLLHRGLLGICRVSRAFWLIDLSVLGLAGVVSALNGGLFVFALGSVVLDFVGSGRVSCL